MLLSEDIWMLKGPFEHVAMTTDKEPSEPIQEIPERPYVRPTLVRYGRLSDLTQGGSFVGNDGNTSCVGNAGDPDQCAS